MLLVNIAITFKTSFVQASPPIQLISNPVKLVGRGVDRGFFSLEEFNEQIFAGVFGYKEYTMIYSVIPWRPFSNSSLKVSESICALKKHDNYLYANTEAEGKIYRSLDGREWQRVRTGEEDIGCGLEVHDGYIYATNSINAKESEGSKGVSRIYRSPTGDPHSWIEEWSSDSEDNSSDSKHPYIREIVNHNGVLYSFGTYYSTVAQKWQGIMLVSDDGTNWLSCEVPFRGFRATSTNTGLLVGTTTNKSSERFPSIYNINIDETIGESSCSRYDYKRIYTHPSQTHFSSIQNYYYAKFATTINGWNGLDGEAQLLMSTDNGKTWKLLHKFAESEIHASLIHNGKLYIATKQEPYPDKESGGVYELDLSEIDKRIISAITLLL
jgi:hypothetical protein